MEKCECCGNVYANSFKVTMGHREYFFDSFECAISKLAPKCTHCETKIIGHGVESKNMIFCCAHCATEAGVYGLKDHVEGPVDSIQ